ncbi:esterase B1-like [Phymastichus coffea]|uniref:esterase B1-like n=1 Tax=Phymastichus coffea TaxID=108790 RepID=UPI00273B6836|nr:esterase B1-like [Phymastichus coffea]
MLLAIFNVILLILSFGNLVVFACVGEPIADTLTGKVHGSKAQDSEGDEYCSFKGIPYAKPPVGDLRFREPQPAEPWTEVREAMVFGENCLQYDLLSHRIKGIEDCLHLNVYTKSLQQGARRPVMVWIHGGAFVCGSGDDDIYGPENFMRKDIVLVTLNYRLGVFGFLNYDDESASGNQGLKDQVLALQWVRDNIAHFGGDPNSVTIFGESAGSASVHYLAISPLARGLFHRVICQSGMVQNPWSFLSNPKKMALRLTNNFNYTGKDPKQAVQFLRTVDALKLAEAQENLLTPEEKLQAIFPFVPTVDLKSKKPFMPVHPEILAAEGIQVPSIIGHNSREGILFYRNITKNYEKFNKEYHQIVHPEVKNILKNYGLTLEDIKHVYFDNDSVTKENMDNLVDLFGDLYFVEGINRALKIQIERSSAPTYFYQFTYDKTLSFIKMWVHTRMSGASHADELFFLFRPHYLDSKNPYPKKDSDKYRITQQMIELWTNFAATGLPTPKLTEVVPILWQPIHNGTVLRYLNICEDLCMEATLSLEQKYYVKLLPAEPSSGRINYNSLSLTSFIFVIVMFNQLIDGF